MYCNFFSGLMRNIGMSKLEEKQVFQKLFHDAVVSFSNPIVVAVLKSAV